MKADDKIANICDEFESNLRAGHPPRLDEFVRQAPAGYEASVCATLVSTALAIDAERDNTCWIDRYLCTEMWNYRREVCQSLTAQLYVEKRGDLARQLGVAEFGEYRAKSVIGFGGFGTLFKAVHKDNRQKVVAVKLAHRDERAQLLLKNEIDVLTALQDRQLTGIPRLMERLVGRDAAGNKFLITDWINGQSLDAWRTDKTPKDDLLTVALQLATIVDRLHSASCCHGDISPGNIMVSEDRGSLLVHLVDFGNAGRAWQPNRLETITRRYAAPELLLGEVSRASASSDIWSLGVVLFELLSGHHPFGKMSETASDQEWGEHLRQGSFGTFKATTKLWETLIGCMSRDPERRLRNCTNGQLALAIPSLEQYISALTALPDELSSNSSRGFKPIRLRNSGLKKLSGWLLALAAPLVLLGVWWLIPRGQHTATLASTQSSDPTTTRPAAPAVQEPSEFIEKTLGMKFRLLPAGTFIMGSPDSEYVGGGVHLDIERQRIVTLKRPFYFGEHEVTRGEFRKFVDAQVKGWMTDAQRENNDDWRTPPWNPNDDRSQDDHPVVRVSWNDAVAFCDWLSGKDHARIRLPLDAEWEYACRANSPKYEPFSTGADILPGQANIKFTPDYNSFGTTPVEQYSPNAWGLFDMNGNAYQWCYNDDGDWAAGVVDYPLSIEVTDPKHTKPRVVRGGAWSRLPAQCRSANRFSEPPSHADPDRGFRVVMEP